MVVVLEVEPSDYTISKWLTGLAIKGRVSLHNVKMIQIWNRFYLRNFISTSLLFLSYKSTWIDNPKIKINLYIDIIDIFTHGSDLRYNFY